MEGIRLAGTFGAYREASVDDVIPEDDGSEIRVQTKRRVFVNFVSFFLFTASPPLKSTHFLPSKKFPN